MKFGVVTFPGSNCDQDMIDVLKTIFNQEVIRLWHKDTDLQKCDMIVLPGGFSFGDYLRSGAIANHSPIMKEVINFAQKGGYVLGICNGFQILCESGLLGGTVLLHNDTQKFICKNIHILPQTQNTVFTSEAIKGKALRIPIAHAEGRFYAKEDVLKELNDRDEVLFRYCNEKGEIIPEANPNGAVENIAGITNKGRNVFGMMPHPERACDSDLGNTNGRILFESLLKNLK